MQPEVRGIYDRLARLVEAINEACDNCYTAKFIDRDYVVGSISQVMTHLQETVPTRECWCCGGRGCRVCHGTGMIPQQVWLRRPVEVGGGE